MKLLDIQLAYWIEWIIWLSIWICLLIVTHNQIESFKLDAICVAASVGTRRSSQNDARQNTNKSNVVSSFNPSSRASYTTSTPTYHRNSSRRLSLQTSPRRYSLNLRPQSMGYQLRKKKLHLQFAGIIGNIFITLLIFPYFRFYRNQTFIRLNIIFTFIPCCCGTCFYVLDIYLSALKTFSLLHLFNKTKNRNVNIYIELKSLQNNMKLIIFIMTAFYIISVFGVCISKLMFFWFFTELSCWILWILLYHRYQAIQALYRIIATDLRLANHKIASNVNLNTSLKQNNIQNTHSVSHTSNWTSHNGIKIDFGNISADNSISSPKSSPTKSYRESKISHNSVDNNSVSLKSSVSNKLPYSISASTSESNSKHSTPRQSITRRVSLTRLSLQIDTKTNCDSPSVQSKNRLSSNKQLFESVSKSLQSIVKSKGSIEKENEITSVKTLKSESISVKERENAISHEASIYDALNGIDDQNEIIEYVNDLKDKLKQIAAIGT
eukprot:542097_1